MKTKGRTAILLPLLLILLAVLACEIPVPTAFSTDATQTLEALATIVAGTLQSTLADNAALETTPPPSSSEEETSSEQIAATSTPSATPSPTACVPYVQVSMNTNCRSGPGQVYDYLGALLVGEQAQIVAQSSIPNYWIIDNPDNPGQSCWLWGQYAQVSCDPGNLPILTPPPTPTPEATPTFTPTPTPEVLGFAVLPHGPAFCSQSSNYNFFFEIRNMGGLTIEYARVKIIDLDNPFSKIRMWNYFYNPKTTCGGTVVERILPGQDAFTLGGPVPYDPAPFRWEITIKVCTADNGGGECMQTTFISEP